MSAPLFVVVALAGGVGAVCRFLLDGAIRARTGARFPTGTVVINVSGSLVLGLLVGLTSAALLPHDWQLALGTGFCGGYTTFSTASFESVRLLGEGRTAVGVGHGVGMLVGSVLAAAAGLWLGSNL